jgi:hypothetical protein
MYIWCRVRGVWGEVYFAVQMSAKGDCVTLLEPDAAKQASRHCLFKSMCCICP